MKQNESHDRELVRLALERATDGVEPNVEPLVAAVPRMLLEAERRRRRVRRPDLLAASIPYAHRAIPQLALAAVALITICTALLLTGNGNSTTASTLSFEELLIAGEGLTDDQLLESMIGPEERR